MGGDHLNYVIKSQYYRFHIDCRYLILLYDCDSHRSQASDKHMALLYQKGRKNAKISDSTETMYTKLGHKRVSPGCKNCLITGEGTYFFFGFPKVLKQTNKYGRGTERHLPKTDESVVRPAGEHC